VFKLATFALTQREDKFATAELPCQSLAGQLRPMQT